MHLTSSNFRISRERALGSAVTENFVLQFQEFTCTTFMHTLSFMILVYEQHVAATFLVLIAEAKLISLLSCFRMYFLHLSSTDIPSIWGATCTIREKKVLIIANKWAVSCLTYVCKSCS